MHEWINTIIALMAFLLGYRVNRKQLNIEIARENDRLQKTKKASLIPSVFMKDSRRKRFAVRNIGEAAASDVLIWINDLPLSNQGQRPIVIADEEIHFIGPLSTIDYPMLGPGEGESRSIQVKITWSDDSGKPGSCRHTLTY